MIKKMNVARSQYEKLKSNASAVLTLGQAQNCSGMHAYNHWGFIEVLVTCMCVLIRYVCNVEALLKKSVRY